MEAKKRVRRYCTRHILLICLPSSHNELRLQESLDSPSPLQQYRIPAHTISLHSGGWGRLDGTYGLSVLICSHCFSGVLRSRKMYSSAASSFCASSILIPALAASVT